MTYWIKQLGLTDNKIQPTDLCGFSRTIDFGSRPTGIKIGDQLFVYAVGHKYLYAQLEVLSVPFEGHPEEFVTGVRNSDYPWLLFCRNLDKTFSDLWFDYKIDLLELAKQYHAETGSPVTTEDSENLNAIMNRKSYVRLQEGFVQYILQKMTSK
jgi:hypothetical protein